LSVRKTSRTEPRLSMLRFHSEIDTFRLIAPREGYQCGGQKNDIGWP
jgi:hypothetical protein